MKIKNNRDSASRAITKVVRQLGRYEPSSAKELHAQAYYVVIWEFNVDHHSMHQISVELKSFSKLTKKIKEIIQFFEVLKF